MFRFALICLIAIFTFRGAVASEPDLAALKEQLTKALPGVSLNKIKPSAVAGIYEIELDNQLLYVSADGKYLFLGDLVDLHTRTNLSEAWREKGALTLINGVGEQNMIVIGPKKPKRTITVFTDVDCPYCAKSHREVPELVAQGVKVRYLMFPRGGLDSPTYHRSVAVWCAADRVKAVGTAKAGGKLEMKTCANPVADHYKLGERIGISGTPTTYLDNGKKLTGYVPSKQLLAILGITGTAPTANVR